MAFPEGASALTHMLVVSDIERSERWYTEVLGARLEGKYGGTSVVLSAPPAMPIMRAPMAGALAQDGIKPQRSSTRWRPAPVSSGPAATRPATPTAAPAGGAARTTATSWVGAML